MYTLCPRQPTQSRKGWYCIQDPYISSLSNHCWLSSRTLLVGHTYSHIWRVQLNECMLIWLDLQFYLSRHWWLSLVRVAQRPGLAFPQILSGLFCCPPVGEFSSLLQALQYMFLLECFKCAFKVLFNLKLNSWHFCSACGFIIPTVIKSLFSVSYP